MSGDCAQQYGARTCYLDRIQRRMDQCKHRSQECETRHLNSQRQRDEINHNHTSELLARSHESKMKKTGKYKTDSGRAKQTNDLTNASRNDSDFNSIGRQLKRKHDCSNNSALVKTNSMGTVAENAMLPNCDMQSLMGNNRPFGFPGQGHPDAKAKKMKIDSDAQFQGNTNTGKSAAGAGNNNCMSGNVGLSVQIVQQFNNEQQRRIETTVNVNTSINSNNGEQSGADMQSVSVNVGPKDIKKESGGQQAANPCGNFMGSNDMQIPASNHGGEDTIGDGLSSLINDTDLDVDIEHWLNELTQNTNDEDGLPEFSLQDSKKQHKNTSAHHQQQNSTPVSSNIQVNMENQFQCKTEKVDFMGFGGNSNNAQQQQQQQQANTKNGNNNQRYFSNESQSNNMSYMPQSDTGGMFNGGKTPPPFSNSNQQSVNMSPHQASSSINGNMTSQHIHKLSVSVDSKFNVLQQQQQQQPMYNHMGMPNNSEKMRQTPESQPRLPRHQSPQTNAEKAVSPSSVSYSVSHQPHPGLSHSIHNTQANDSSFYGQMTQSNDHNHLNTSSAAMPNNHNSRMHMPPASQGYNQGYPGSMNRNDMANANMGPNLGHNQTPGISRAQQLKELAEKRGPAGGGINQWNANASASVNMSSSVGFNGHAMNQQQHISADMQSYTSFQGSGMGMNTIEANLQSNNFSAASAAAQAALVASERQQHNLPYGHSATRFSHYQSEQHFMGNQNHPSPDLASKQMYGSAQSRRFSHRTQPPQQHMVRRVRPNPGDINPGTRPGVMFYNDMPEHSYRARQPNMPGASAMNGSASVNIRMNQAVGGQQQQQQRHMHSVQHQKFMMEQYNMNMSKQGDMMSNTGTLISPRAPNHMSRAPMTQPGMPHQPAGPAMGTPRLPGGSNSAIFPGNGGNTKMAVGQPGLRPQLNLQSAQMQSWKRVNHVQAGFRMNNAQKMPGYAPNMSGQMGAKPGGYVPDNVQRFNVLRNAIASGRPINNPQGMRTSPLNSQQPQPLGGAFPQPQRHIIPPSNGGGGMNPNMNRMSGQQAITGISGLVGQTGNTNDVLSAMESVFDGPTSPNVDLNLLTDVIDNFDR